MINSFLPEYDYNEIHAIIIKAPVEKIYYNLRRLDFSASGISRFLFKIRGLDTKNMCFDRMIDNGSFFTIYEKENQEWIVGLLAESFKMSSPLKPDQDFIAWNPGKGIKIAWNFTLKVISRNNVKVCTETRIQLLNKKSKVIFSVYWMFVRPFSGLIRLEMLKILKKNCQN